MGSTTSTSDTRPAVAEIAFPPGTCQATFLLKLPSSAVVSKVDIEFCEGHRKSMLPSRLIVEAGNRSDSMITVASQTLGTSRLVRGDR